ncbi:hypothetical protein VNI00_008378 [Paramarasmius palmivorus]|uniref:D-xylose 1-dehydrogenase (NADP(+), D-xylono-1,5-lactone-forming) n=1 Tax=Paramarasmius palmivorus TaxID=297713 RepID=A0AAW0CV00_9AGAR
MLAFLSRIQKISNPPSDAIQPKENNALRFGCIGAAKITPGALVNPSRTHSEVVLYAIAARDKARAEGFAHKHGFQKSYGGATAYQDMIDDPEIDVVYNPLPNGLHFEWTMKALQGGKHVLLEKPATNTEDEARQIFSLADQKGLVVLEAFHYRFHPSIQRMKAILDNNELGAIKSISAHLTAPEGTAKSDDIRWKYELGGGSTMDPGSYTVNVLRYLASPYKPKSVLSASAEPYTSAPQHKQVDRKFTATIDLEHDILGEISSDLNEPRIMGIIPRMPKLKATVQCEGGTIEIFNFLIPHYYHYITVNPTGKKSRVEKVYRFADDSKGEEWWTTYRYQLEAFVDKIRGRKPQTWLDPQDTIDNMKWIEAIYSKAEKLYFLVLFSGLIVLSRMDLEAGLIRNTSTAVMNSGVRLMIFGARRLTLSSKCVWISRCEDSLIGEAPERTEPNILREWPWKRSTNPHTEECGEELREWSRKFQFFPAKTQDALCDAALLLASLAYPTLSKVQFRVAASLMIFFGLFDDVSDRMDAAQVQICADMIMSTLRTALPSEAGAQNEDQPMIASGLMRFTYWGILSDNNLSKNSTVILILWLIKPEIGTALLYVSQVQTYMNVRRNDLGAKPAFALILMGEDVTPEVVDSDLLTSLRSCAVDMLILANDIYSFNVEQAKGDTHNIVSIIMIQDNIAANDAIARVSRMHDELVHKFLRLCDDLPSRPESINDAMAKKYVDGLGNWIRANDCFSFESRRYFGKVGSRIQQERIVELLPRVNCSEGIHSDAAISHIQAFPSQPIIIAV